MFCMPYPELAEATFYWSGQCYFYCHNKNMANYSLAKPMSKVRISVKPWPDLPGWFPKPWPYHNIMDFVDLS